MIVAKFQINSITIFEMLLKKFNGPTSRENFFHKMSSLKDTVHIFTQFCTLLFVVAKFKKKKKRIILILYITCCSV